MSANTEVSVTQRDNTALMTRPEPVATVTPFADIFERDDAYVLMLDMPGASKDSISITVDANSLVVRARPAMMVDSDAKMLCHEIVNADFFRSFNLSSGINRDKIDATYENGVLTITLYKNEELRPREIKIH